MAVGAGIYASWNPVWASTGHTVPLSHLHPALVLLLRPGWVARWSHRRLSLGKAALVPWIL